MEITRIAAGVMFESDVLALVDSIAEEQRRSRSFIINQIIRHFARQQEPKGVSIQQTPVADQGSLIKF